jgi:hypothetical protein
LLRQLLVNPGVVVAEGAYADDGDVNQTVGNQ